MICFLHERTTHMNFFDFLAKFPTEEAIIHYFIQKRYNNQPVCPHCGYVERISHNTKRPRYFQCNNCGNSFSVFRDTIFEKSTTDLRKWIYAIHLFLNSKKGISGYQLQRELGVTYKTAWRMLDLIRASMASQSHEGIYEAVVEIDETYVGGKPRKGGNNATQGKSKRGRGTSKTPIVGVVGKTDKHVHAKVALPNQEGRRLTGKQLLEVLNTACKEAPSTVHTDQFRAYNHFERQGIMRLVVDHSTCFVKDDVHTNNIESFWAILKRGVYDIYHHVSVKHMQHYINEFCFRWNNRNIEQSFDKLIVNASKTPVRLKVA